MISVLLSGANGFIGSRVARSLASAGISVEKVKDVLKPVRPRRRPDAIIHLAGVTRSSRISSDPDQDYAVNVQGTLTMLEVARRFRSRLYLASSSAVYAEPRARLVSESSAIGPFGPYGRSKRIAEILCESFWQMHGVSTMALRFFNVYGPGQRPPYVIPYLVQSALKGRRFSIKFPDAERDYLHVDDVADLFRSLMRRPFSGFRVFNVGTGVGKSVRSVLSDVEKITGKKVPWFQAGLKGREAHRVVANTRALRSFSDWTPRVSFEKGIRGVIDDYRP